MKTETLKKLINQKYGEICQKGIMAETIETFKEEVFKLIDLYEEDNQKFIPAPGTTTEPIDFWKTVFPYKGDIYDNVPDEVPYGQICPCNPKNGGSGICGCVMGNNMVPNPKKYGYPQTTSKTTAEINLQDPYSPTAKWATSAAGSFGN